MRDIKITSLIKFYTILLLSEKPKYGYELIKRVGEKTGRNISPGEIYPFLKTLKRHGYITSEKATSEKAGPRERKIYRLTKDGRVFVKNILERFGSLIDTAIEPKLKACAHCGCEVYRGGYKERVKGKLLNFCCVHCAKSYKAMT